MIDFVNTLKIQLPSPIKRLRIMSASQLLRILQTLPACDDDENCAFNTDELNSSMNKSFRCTNPFLSNENDNQVNFWNSGPEHDQTSNHDDHITFRKSPSARDGNPHLVANATRFRVDKHSVEYELPELVVCYKESDFHVKDMCIDEGIHDHETISIHRDNNHEVLRNSVPVNGDDDDDMIDVSLDSEFLKHEWLRGSTMACCSIDVELSSSVQNATNLQDDVSTDRQDWSRTTFEFPMSSNIYDDDINRHPLQGSKDELGENVIVGNVAEKEDKDCELKNTCNESKKEESFTFHFDTTSVVDQKDMASGYKVALKDHETRYVDGEASFSMAGVISELISCSRPMAFAGGISTRSDGNATSNRSFAFPTLETEYTSSPVRMGKVGRKRLQKHRGWRKGLLCCKF